jgi:hypothetical protein
MRTAGTALGFVVERLTVAVPIRLGFATLVAITVTVVAAASDVGAA